MLKWIISDLDGTLLGHNHETREMIVDENTIDFLNKLNKTNKYKMTIATGRHFANVLDIIDEFKFDYDDNGFIIGMNGAQIYSCKDKKLIQNTYIENELLKNFNVAIEYFEKNYNNKFFVIGYQDNFHNIFVYDNKSDYLKDNIEIIKKHEDKNKSLNMILIENFNEVSNVYKIIFSLEPPYNYEKILVDLKRILPNMNFAQSSERFIEVFPKSIDKSIAIDYINQNYYNFDKNEIIAFGDSFNDLEMLEYAGTSVTKQSAHAKVRKICDYVIDADSSTFVADALELLFGE